MLTGFLGFVARVGNLFSDPPPSLASSSSSPPPSLPPSKRPSAISVDLTQQFLEVLRETYQSKEDIQNRLCTILVIKSASWSEFERIIEGGISKLEAGTKNLATSDSLNRLNRILASSREAIRLFNELYVQIKNSHCDIKSAKRKEEHERLKYLRSTINNDFANFPKEIYSPDCVSSALSPIKAFWRLNCSNLFRCLIWPDLSATNPHPFEIRSRVVDLTEKTRINPYFCKETAKAIHEKYIKRWKYHTAHLITPNQDKNELMIFDLPKASSSHHTFFSHSFCSSSNKTASKTKSSILTHNENIPKSPSSNNFHTTSSNRRAKKGNITTISELARRISEKASQTTERASRSSSKENEFFYFAEDDNPKTKEQERIDSESKAYLTAALHLFHLEIYPTLPEKRSSVPLRAASPIMLIPSSIPLGISLFESNASLSSSTTSSSRDFSSIGPFGRSIDLSTSSID